MNNNPWPLIVGAGVLLVATNPQVQKWLTEALDPRPDPATLARNQLLQLKAAFDEYEANRASKTVQPAYVPPVDDPLARLVTHPAVVLVLGHRGSGKSALAIRLQELLRDIAPAYAIGLPAKASRLLPEWYGLVDDASTIPPNAIIYIPESYRLFHSRSTQSAQGRAIGELVNLSRHRRHTLIFDVQNPAHLDRNIVSEADVVLVKEPGPLQQGFERSQFKGIMDQARAAFASVVHLRRKRVVWVVAPPAGIQGQLMENLLPTCWTDSLSRIFGDSSASSNGRGTNQAATPRAGKRTPPKSKEAKAKQMKAAGHSYGEIANTLGISKSYAYKLVKGS